MSVPSRSKTTCSYAGVATRLTVGRGSRREGRAAAAGVRRPRVRELEPAAAQAAHVVDLGSAEMLRASGWHTGCSVQATSVKLPSLMRPASYYRPRALRRGAPLEAFAQTENVIAFCRVLVAATTLAVFVVDPRQPAFRPDLGWIVLAAYVGFSLLVFLLARRGYVKPEVRGWVVAADLGWIVVITLFTEGGATPFFLLGTFVISSVSVRWGLAVSAPITVLLALSYPGLILFAGHVIDAEAFPFARAHWFRPVYLLALGYLIAYLGEHERRSKQKLGLMLDLTTIFRRHRAPASGFTRLMRWALDYFAAQRALLVLRDPESGKFFAWDMTRRPTGSRIGLRITDGDPFPLPFAASTEGFLANELRPATALCYDVVSGAMQRKVIPPDV